MKSTNLVLFIAKVFFAGFLMLTLPLSVCASGMHLKIDAIKGESQDNKHKDEIQVVAWEFAVSNPGSFQGSRFISGRADYSDIVITKYVDAASTKLAAAVVSGQHLKEAILSVSKASQSKDYLMITLTDVVLTSISMSGSDGDDRLAESVNLSFAKMEMEYIGIDQNDPSKEKKSTLVIDRLTHKASVN